MNCKLNIYENNYIDTIKQPLFLGCARNTQRFDKNKFDFLSKISLRMQDFFWKPEEVKLNKDKVDFEILTASEKHIITSQLQKLVMLDSVQGRTPLMIFGQLTTNPEFEGALLEQEYFECRIHSRSYSYMVENMYTDASEVFEKSWDNELLLKHSETVTREYNGLYEYVIEYIYKTNKGIEIPDDWMHEFKRKILLALVSMNILEGIRFYIGFASVWSLLEFSNKMPGSSRILQFIQRDEKEHLAFTQYLIKELKKDPEFKDIWTEVTSKVYDMYFEASEEEFEWADYLFSQGSVLGMNAEIGKLYIKYLTNQRLKAIGLKPIYPEVNKLPIPWVNKYINLGTTETSLQESEAVDYIVDPLVGEIDDIDFNKMYKEI